MYMIQVRIGASASTSPAVYMTLFRPFLLAGLALFLAAQQALCACAVPQDMAPAAMAMAHEMPAGHACDETTAPEHDTATCPHCGTDTQLILQIAQTVPTLAIPISPAPALFQLADVAALPQMQVRLPKRALYEAAGPPRQTPRQLKTRFLN